MTRPGREDKRQNDLFLVDVVIHRVVIEYVWDREKELVV